MRLSWDPMAARDVRLESAAVWFQASTAWARPTSAACSASSGSTVRVAGPGPGPASSAAARTRGRSPRPGPVQGLPQVLICRGVLDPVVTVRTSLGVVTGRSGASVPAGAGRLFAVVIRHIATGDGGDLWAGAGPLPRRGDRGGPVGAGEPAAGESGAVLHLVRGAVESMAHHQGAVEPGGQTDVVHAADDGVCGCS